MLLFGEHRLPRILKSFPFFIVPTDMTYVFCQKSAVLLKDSVYTIGRKKLSNLNEYEIDAAHGIFQRTSDQDTKKLTLLTSVRTF